MGKPVDKADAFRMLDKIRGTYHYVVTGVCLIDVSTGSEKVMHYSTHIKSGLMRTVSNARRQHRAKIGCAME